MDEPFLTKQTPAFSRAADSDEEDEELAGQPVDASALNRAVLRLTAGARAEIGNAGHLDECTTLLLAVGVTASRFVDAYVLGGGAVACERLGLVATGIAAATRNSLGQDAPSDANCWLVRPRILPRLLVCCARAPVLAAQTHSFAQAVLDLVQPDPEHFQLLVLGSQDADGGVEAGSPRLRALRTARRRRAGLAAPLLEPPGMAVGLPAQLLTACQARGLAAVLYLCCGADVTTDDAPLSSSRVRVFEPILADTWLSDIVSSLGVDLRMGLEALTRLTAQMKLRSAPVTSSMYT